MGKFFQVFGDGELLASNFETLKEARTVAKKTNKSRPELIIKIVSNGDNLDEIWVGDCTLQPVGNGNFLALSDADLDSIGLLTAAGDGLYQASNRGLSVSGPAHLAEAAAQLHAHAKSDQYITA